MAKYQITVCQSTSLYQVEEVAGDGSTTVEFKTADPFEAVDWMTLARMEDDQAIYCRFG